MMSAPRPIVRIRLDKLLVLHDAGVWQADEILDGVAAGWLGVPDMDGELLRASAVERWLRPTPAPDKERTA